MITGEQCKTCGHKDYEHMGGRCYGERHKDTNCSCATFSSPTAEAVASLPDKEKMGLVCANILNINPEQISKVEVHSNGGYFREITCTVVMYSGTNPDEWFVENLPNTKTDWIIAYLAKRSPEKPV